VTLAIGRLTTLDGAHRGTVFAVTDRLALTTFHGVGSRETGKIALRRLRCEWDGYVSDAVVHDGDPHLDVAVLRLDRSLPAGLEPIQLTSHGAEHMPFTAPGAPKAVPEISGFTVSGEITSLTGKMDGAPLIQLLSWQSAGKLPLAGFSGAPVLVGQPQRALGVIRYNSPRPDQPELATGATVFATPVADIMRRWPFLPSADSDDVTSLRSLLRNLANRDQTRTDAQVREGVVRLLRGSGIGLADLDNSSGRAKGPIETVIGTAAVVTQRDLRDAGAARAVRQQLAKALGKHDQDQGRRWVGLATDGAEWWVFQRIAGKLGDVAARLLIDPAKPDVEQTVAWLESLLASGHDIAPTPDEIVRRLGSESPSYLVDFAELADLYAQHRNVPEIRVKRALWAKLLTTAVGIQFNDEDRLFIDHTLLVLVAEVVGHAVVGFDPGDPAITAGAIVSGELFTRAQIGGVVEADFFDWVAEVPAGERFIKDLARRLTRFSWQYVEHDVMKVLYESIISPEVRRALGEYYTPDWLAAAIVDECVRRPLDERVLDASCGSGTFLFHAVRHYIDAAEAAGIAPADVVVGASQHVVGFDVHPVAVTLARVTYLLAIGPRRLQESDRPAFAVPVYLADSMRWGQETTLWSDDDLSVPADLDHSTFVSDTAFVTPANRTLRFPGRIVADAGLFDRLVAELATHATTRDRGTTTPTLTGVFRRLGIEDVDERSALRSTFKLMCELHDQRLDHIWGYYVRNLARPVWMHRPENRADVLVGNPPWLAYRYMTEPQKATFRTMSTDRSLWAGASHTTNQDLSALFVTRCIEQYLKPTGRFGYVMPWATLTRGAYAGFRRGDYSSPTTNVTVSFDRPWDLHRLKPAFFPVPACVVFGTRTTAGGGIHLNQVPQIWIGEFNTKTATFGEARPNIAMTDGEPPKDLTTAPSPYASRFGQGATIVPQMLFLVEEAAAGPLGAGAGRRTLRSHRSAYEKDPWRQLPSLSGVVEQEFVRPIYRGNNLLPFRCTPSVSAVIPWDGQCLLGGDDERLDVYPGLAHWWRTADKLWQRHRTSARLSLAEQIDYRNKLSRQLPASKYRVVYAASGMYAAAGVVTDVTAVIEHQLYWASVADLDEARFLEAIFNSEVLTMAVRPLQARGEHNPRHFDKYVLQLPIPLYDRRDEMHVRLVELAWQAEEIVAELALPDKRFEAQRAAVRRTLTERGVNVEIDSIVKTFFSA
jgi:SAM-dependent methyltransferase